jgi:dihydropyrimidinase
VDVIVIGGTVVTAVDIFRADLAITGGRIAQIGLDLPRPAGCNVIDANNLYVFPGGVDAHTHLDSRGQGTRTADDFRSGTIAAACGGTTSIIDFCFPERGQSLFAGLTDWHARAEGQAVIDYGFHAGVLEETDAIQEEIPRLPGAGVATLKVFMAYKGGYMVSDATLYQTLQQAARQSALVLVHAEHGDAIAIRERELLAAGKTAPKYHAVARPARAEAEATARAVALAELVGAPLFAIHVSCEEALAEIERGRARGVRVYAETCAHYLYCSVDDMDRPAFEGAKYVCSPPLRERRHQGVLWRALEQGTIQTVGSDHSPFDFVGVTQKERGRDDFTRIPNGVPGIEERLVLLYQGVVTGKLSLNRFVDVVATAPARLMGLQPRKGSIAIGADADLVLWDPKVRWTLGAAMAHHQVDYSLYEGLEVQGAARTVLLRGEVIVRDRQPVVTAGGGQFLVRSCSPSVVA